MNTPMMPNWPAAPSSTIGEFDCVLFGNGEVDYDAAYRHHQQIGPVQMGGVAQEGRQSVPADLHDRPLIYFDEQLVVGNVLSCADRNLGHRPRARCPDRVFHLHGFQNAQGVGRFHGLAGAHVDTQDSTGHRGPDFPMPVFGRRGWRARSVGRRRPWQRRRRRRRRKRRRHLQCKRHLRRRQLLGLSACISTFDGNRKRLTVDNHPQRARPRVRHLNMVCLAFYGYIKRWHPVVSILLLSGASAAATDAMPGHGSSTPRRAPCGHARRLARRQRRAALATRWPSGRPPQSLPPERASR